MSQGSFSLFNRFKVDMAEGVHNLESDSFKVAFITLQAGGTPTITPSTIDPRWGASGATDLSSNEVSGTNYTAGGNSANNPTATEVSGVVTFDVDDPSTWLQSATAPTDIKTAILYNDTAAGKQAIGFIDMTGDGTSAISLVDGDIIISFNSSGLFTIT